MKKCFFPLMIGFLVFSVEVFAQSPEVGLSAKKNSSSQSDGKSSVEIASEISGYVYLDNIKVGKVSEGGKIILDGLDAETYVFEIRSKLGTTKQTVKILPGEDRFFSVAANDSGIFWEGVAVKSPGKNFSQKSIECRSNKFSSGEKVVVKNMTTGHSLAMNVTGASTSANPDVLVELSPEAAKILKIGDTNSVTGNTVSVRRSFFWKERHRGKSH